MCPSGIGVCEKPPRGVRKTLSSVLSVADGDWTYGAQTVTWFKPHRCSNVPCKSSDIELEHLHLKCGFFFFLNQLSGFQR